MLIFSTTTGQLHWKCRQPKELDQFRLKETPNCIHSRLNHSTKISEGGCICRRHAKTEWKFFERQEVKVGDGRMRRVRVILGTCHTLVCLCHRHVFHSTNRDETWGALVACCLARVVAALMFRSSRTCNLGLLLSIKILGPHLSLSNIMRVGMDWAFRSSSTSSLPLLSRCNRL